MRNVRVRVNQDIDWDSQRAENASQAHHFRCAVPDFGLDDQ
jgi:hypothetical protein